MNASAQSLPLLRKTKNNARVLRWIRVASTYLTVGLLLGLVACTQQRQERLLREGDHEISESRYVKAVELFRKALSMDPASAYGVKAAYKLGFVLETYFKDYEGALLSYEEFIKNSPDKVRNYGVRKRMASLQLEQLRDFEGAQESYKLLLDESPKGPEAGEFMFKMASAAFQQNKFEESRGIYQSLVERYPNSELVPGARYEIGNTYYMQERYEVALQALKQVLREHPQSKYSIEAQFLMARCLEQQLNFAEALEMYEGLEGRYFPKQVLSQRIEKIKPKVKK
ncbi:MAG: tetratricopeptide repeat protein [Bdellovibrionales bacterium]|nr:tetratricopeptide repeat protein [Bdellovibrionales bacterium]